MPDRANPFFQTKVDLFLNIGIYRYMKTNDAMLNPPVSISLKQTAWNPYLVGVGIGVLSWLAFLLVNKPIGMSTEVSKFSGWLASLFVGRESMLENPYWAKTTPVIGYSTVFLLFTAVGAFISSKLGRDFQLERIPSVWREHQGPSVPKRMVAAFGGGFLLLYGARLAGGCTSGHGISGTLQLALSSWIFFPVMFVGGILMARLLFRKN